MKRLQISDPSPTPDARRVAELVGCDCDTYLYWRARDGKGRRLAEIAWPEAWAEEVSKETMEQAGFEVRVL